jgi:hypothetical protein
MRYTNTDQPECQSIRRNPFTPIPLSLRVPSLLVLLVLYLLLSTWHSCLRRTVLLLYVLTRFKLRFWTFPSLLVAVIVRLVADIGRAVPDTGRGSEGGRPGPDC